jgi:branched-subunit amino acid aminotransferase/4-amino-4-deoxychorismate lyase
MSDIRRLTREDILNWMRGPAPAYRHAYYAMYSSIYGGIVTDPMLMLVPVDDHLVHRGDGVFETCKCVDGGIYNLRAHLARLQNSAEGISLAMPWSPADLQNIVVQTVRASGHQNCLIRILVSRGPGSFGVSPYDCPEPGLYVVASEYKAPFMEQHPAGARVKASRYPVKSGGFARIKSANYLVNVLMKKEAVDDGVDFVVSFDEGGFLAEGATENAGIVTQNRILQVPRPERILMGTTMVRVLELAQELVRVGELKGIEHANIPYTAVRDAAEMLIFGTTPDVTAVAEFDGRPVKDGKPGPIWARLAALLREDILHNAAMRTDVWP